MPSDSKKKRDAKKKEGAKAALANGSTNGASKVSANDTNGELTYEGISTCICFCLKHS